MQITPTKYCKSLRRNIANDFVIHLPDGRYGLFEVKSSDELISDGIANLEKMVKLIKEYNVANPNNTIPLPTIRAIITDDQYGYLSNEGIYIVPIGCLKN